MKKGLVVKLIGGLYTVLDSETKERIVCNASGKLRHSKVSKDSSFKKDSLDKDARIIKMSPKVGDYVTYQEEGRYILDVMPRNNSLRRPDVANVDQVLLIFAATNPKLSFNLLDHFIVLIEKEEIDLKIIITKFDLLDDQSQIELKENMKYYEKIGYNVYYTSMHDKMGFDEIKPIFKDKISVLAGQTGAGKSTFLNCLDESFNLQTQEISKALGRGKHTTRHSELLDFNDGLIADTPGFSSLDFFNFEVSDLNECFIDFKELSNGCRFKGCSHINEPNCNVKNHLGETMINSRYENYVKFYNEIKQQKKVY